MWIATFKVWHEGSAVLEASRDIDAKLYSYYLNLTVRGGKQFVTKVMVATGREADKAVAATVADKRLRILRVEGNQVFYENTAKHTYHAHIFGSNTFFIKPQFIERGFEYWTVASWDKAELLKLSRKIAAAGHRAKIELLSIKAAPLRLFEPEAFDGLTALQRGAFLNAVEAGYYTIPRKVSLEELAKQLKTPRTTLREHLRKAEGKLLPKLAAMAAVM
jgi:predicted DNA binding protein